MSGSSHGNQRNYSQDEHDRGRSLGPAYDQQRSLGGGDPKGLTTGITAIDKYLKLIPPAPDFCWSNCTGRKKAVCIGINYIGQRDELKGCVNDARHVRNYLMQYHGFKKSDILLLTDDGRGIEPTRKNMLDAMHWLVRKAKMHDSLVFHYSGHGGQKPDDTGKEADGMDEGVFPIIFPVDYKRAGDIIDDELYIQLVQPLAAGCRLTAVFDSCHSGTVLDLPYLHSAHGRLRGLKHISKRCQHRNAPHADVISLSACKDDETSADTFHGGVAVGAMSYYILIIRFGELEENPKQTYDDLLAHLRHILVPKYNQKAQLGGSHPLVCRLSHFLLVSDDVHNKNRT
ncbi:caspase domain-containing protein [Crucibulum laeve]|uniref:Caspase domain-containing protein n=1 Tax=Crucibulum laeve TaxID=68775 RepID=A0A5C3M1X1_9AGAR|nr:caspase domain-containing protein [Crucibulum laeve]